MNNKLSRVTSIGVGIGASVLLLVLGFGVIQRTFIKADDLLPRDVIISEVGPNSAKITWTTSSKTQGVIEYGTSPTALNFFAPESQSTDTHSVDLTLLTPTTTYHFQIRIGDKKFDNGGVPWSFTTKGPGEKAGDASLSPAAAVAPVVPVVTIQPTQGQTSVEVQSDTEKPPPALSCSSTDCTTICTQVNEGTCQVADLVKNKCVGKFSFSAGKCQTITPTP